MHDDRNVNYDSGMKKNKRKGRAFLLVLAALVLIAANAAAVLRERSDEYITDFNLIWDGQQTYIGQDVGCSVEITYSLPFMKYIFPTSSVAWATSNPDVVSIGGSVPHAVGAGSAELTASVCGGKFTRSINAEVVYLGELSASAESMTLGKGEKQNLTAGVSGDLLEGGITYSSSDEKIVKAENGVIEGVGTGSAEITVSAYGYVDAVCSVEVLAAPVSVVPQYESCTMGTGEAWRMEVKTDEASHCDTFTFASSNETVASVDENGTVTAGEKGRADITVTAYNGVSAVCSVEVLDPPQTVALTENNIGLYAGATHQLMPQVNPGSGGVAFEYTSSDEKVCTVDSSGVVTATGHGTATVECRSYNGLSASCTVSGTVVDYNTPYISDKVISDVQALAQSFPELIKTEIAGQSAMGRDIPLMKFGKGSREALIVAEVHANENAVTNFTMRCVEEYAAAYYSENGHYDEYDVKKLLDEWTLYVIPMVNPDGMDIVNTDEVLPLWTNGKEPDNDVQRGVPWRQDYTANGNGVNLNRNFPFRWEETLTSTDGPSLNKYRGDSAGSEPETQMLVKICSEHEFEWMFTMHVKGNMIYWRDEYSKKVPGDQALADRLHKVCGFKLLSASKLKNLGGGFENWFRAEFNRPGFCIELIKETSTRMLKDENFERITVWKKSKYAFICGMMSE